MLVRKLRGPRLSVIRDLNIDSNIISPFPLGPLHILHASVSTYKGSVAQDSGVGGVQCMLPAICGTRCALHKCSTCATVNTGREGEWQKIEGNEIIPCLIMSAQTVLGFQIS